MKPTHRSSGELSTGKTHSPFTLLERLRPLFTPSGREAGSCLFVQQTEEPKWSSRRRRFAAGADLSQGPEFAHCSPPSPGRISKPSGFEGSSACAAPLRTQRPLKRAPGRHKWPRDRWWRFRSCPRNCQLRARPESDNRNGNNCARRVRSETPGRRVRRGPKSVGRLGPTPLGSLGPSNRPLGSVNKIDVRSLSRPTNGAAADDDEKPAPECRTEAPTGCEATGRARQSGT